MYEEAVTVLYSFMLVSHVCYLLFLPDLLSQTVCFLHLLVFLCFYLYLVYFIILKAREQF